MADKHVCKHCGAPRSGHDCPVAKRRVNKGDNDDFVIMAAAVALTTPQERMFPADPPPIFEAFDVGEDLQGRDFGSEPDGTDGD